MAERARAPVGPARPRRHGRHARGARRAATATSAQLALDVYVHRLRAGIARDGGRARRARRARLHRRRRRALGASASVRARAWGISASGRPRSGSGCSSCVRARTPRSRGRSAVYSAWSASRTCSRAPRRAGDGGGDDADDDGEDQEQCELAGGRREPEPEVAQRRGHEAGEQHADRRCPSSAADDGGDHALVADDAPDLAPRSRRPRAAGRTRACARGSTRNRLLAMPNSEITTLIASSA